MSLEEASEYALRRKDRSTRRTCAGGPQAGELMGALTRREEVAALVALGFTNREISTRLSISKHPATTSPVSSRSWDSVHGPDRQLGYRARAACARP